MRKVRSVTAGLTLYCLALSAWCLAPSTALAHESGEQHQHYLFWAPVPAAEEQKDEVLGAVVIKFPVGQAIAARNGEPVPEAPQQWQGSAWWPQTHIFIEHEDWDNYCFAVRNIGRNWARSCDTAFVCPSLDPVRYEGPLPEWGLNAENSNCEEGA